MFGPNVVSTPDAHTALHREAPDVYGDMSSPLPTPTYLAREKKQKE